MNKVRTTKTGDKKYIKFLSQHGVNPLFDNGVFSYYDKDSVKLLKIAYKVMGENT